MIDVALDGDRRRHVPNDGNSLRHHLKVSRLIEQKVIPLFIKECELRYARIYRTMPYDQLLQSFCVERFVLDAGESVCTCPRSIPARISADYLRRMRTFSVHDCACISVCFAAQCTDGNYHARQQFQILPHLTDRGAIEGPSPTVSHDP